MSAPRAANERRRASWPRTPTEVARVLAPWLGIWAGLMLLQFVLVVAIDGANVERLTLNERTVFRRYGDTMATDGLFSVLTLLCTAIGIGAAALTTTLSHLRRDDRTFAAAVSILFTVLAMEEQLELHERLGWDGPADEIAVLAVIVLYAVWIGVAWPQRVVRVWPIIVVAGGAQVAALLLNAFAEEGHLEEWLELLGAVFLAGIAISLTRQTVMEAMARRRPPSDPAPEPEAGRVSPPR